MILSNGVTIFLSVLLFVFARPLIALFANEPLMIQAGVDCITKFALFYFVFNTLNVLNSMMRGYGDGLAPLYTSLASLVTRLAFAYLISGLTGKISNVWWSIPIGWLLGLGMASLFYKFGNWRTKSIIIPPEVSAELEAESEIIV
jgi:Na+-driven multidrug efflux pump